MVFFTKPVSASFSKADRDGEQGAGADLDQITQQAFVIDSLQ